MKTFISFSLLVVLCSLVIGTVWAADDPLTLKIYATDTYKSDSLFVGLDVAGTYGIDLTLGEYELPPYPPTFDFRSISYTHYSSVGKGVRTDYHKLVHPNQTDIWQLEFTSAEEGHEVTFSWDNTGLGSSGGYWALTELDGTPLCDMTTHTSYTYPNYDINPQFILLWRGDSKAFLTATSQDLAYQYDIKGIKNAKGKAIKKAADGSEGWLTFTWAGLDSVNDLHVTFSKAVQILSITPTCIATPTPLKKNTQWDFDFSPDWLYTTPPPANNVVKMFVRTHAGKGKAAELHADKYYWTKTAARWPVKSKDLGPQPLDPLTERAVLPKPNWYNLIDQVYQVRYPAAAKGPGICVGTTATIATVKGKAQYHYIKHPKYGDISKTLYFASKVPPYTHVEAIATSGAVPGCWEKDAKGKAIPYKINSTWAPKTGQYNPLIAELLALKVNVDVNDLGYTGAGSAGMLKNLLIAPNPTISDCTWLPISVDSLIHLTDWYMSKCTLRTSDPTTTAGWLYSTISRINAAFTGALDTESWWANGVIAKPARNMAQQPYPPPLYRPNWSSGPDPVNYFSFKESEPVRFKLDQNYPNPFNPTTTIAFELPEDAIVTLKIYNLLGQEVETLADQEEFTEGTNEIPFDASRYASGVYYYRLVVNDGQFQQVKKMMLLK